MSHKRSAVSQLARVRDLSAADGPNLISGNSDDGRSLSRERHELDFVSLLLRINVNHCSNVASLKAFVAEGRGQNNSVVFADHMSLPYYTG